MLLNPYRFSLPAAAFDPHWEKVGLYMRFNGSNGLTAFADEKCNLLSNRGGVIISTADGFGGACGSFLSGTYLYSGVIPGISGLTPSTAWSVEVRAKVTWAGDRAAGLFAYSPTAGADDFRFFIQRGGSQSYIYVAAEGVTTGWYGQYTHINGQFMSFQASCDGTTIRVFVDGSPIVLTSFDYSGRLAYQAGPVVGAVGNTYSELQTSSLVGQMDELRVTKGVARNTSPYTPATDQFPKSVPVVAPHTYWRIRYLSTEINSYCSAGEIEMAATVGGADQCVGGAAIASTSGPGGDKSLAFNNSTSSAWYTFNPPDYIGYQFPAPVTVASLRFTAETGTAVSPTASPKDFNIEYSDNGTDWAIAASFIGQTGWTAGETRTFSW